MKIIQVPHRVIQNQINAYYEKYHQYPTIFDGLQDLQQNVFQGTDIAERQTVLSWQEVSDKAFEQYLSHLTFPVVIGRTEGIITSENVQYEEQKGSHRTSHGANLQSEHQSDSLLIQESALFKEDFDIHVFQQLYNIQDVMHEHDYYEMFYVYKGQCQLVFENENCLLQEGKLCLLAPNSKHSLVHQDEKSIVITIGIRKSTFSSSFFELFTKKNLLASFLGSQMNYLLFTTDASEELKWLVRNLIVAYNKEDDYANSSCIHWLNLLFILLLRNYQQDIQHYQAYSDEAFHLIMTYIQANYHQLTLGKLVETFHYSESHLCNLIKKNTGMNFSKWVTKMKMTDAKAYLLNTNWSIEKISEQVGYHSSDHFSRVFKGYYGCSPRDYRQKGAI